MQRRLGRTIVLILLVWLAATQVAVIRLVGNDLSPLADPYSEADALRSAEYYAKFGLTSNVGLPNVLYGHRFPKTGVATGPEALFGGVYTRYPPLPNLLCGLFEITIGYQHVWAWRLFPVALTLLATAFLFFSLETALGSLTAAFITVFASAVPMTITYMNGLHFQGYAHALFLVQLALLVRLLFDGEAGVARRVAAIAIVAFVQGWLSFEYIFVVSAAAIPIALVARQFGHRAPWRTVLLATVAAGAGFFGANVLHFIQVIAFHGSVATAYADFHARAVERMGGYEKRPYVLEVLFVIGRYIKVLLIGPYMIHFAAFLPAFTFVVAGAAFWRRARRGDLLALLAAYTICLLWIVAMPQHADDHTHFVPRIFFLAYFTALLVTALRLREWLESLGAATL